LVRILLIGLISEVLATREETAKEVNVNLHVFSAGRSAPPLLNRTLRRRSCRGLLKLSLELGVLLP
jgi:hypothetical protein